MRTVQHRLARQRWGGWWRPRWWLAVGLLGVTLFLTDGRAIADATVYIVATNGNDNNPGTLELPLRTIQKAITKAAAGERIYVRGGAYTEAIRIDKAGTLENPFVVAAYPGEQPVLDGEYRLPAPPRTGWVYCNNAMTPPRCYHYGALVAISGDYVLFEGFEIMRSAGRGIVISRTSGRPNTVWVRNNKIHDIRDAGTLVYYADNVTFERNQVWASGDFAPYARGASQLNWPVAVSGRATNNTLYRSNRIFNNWGEGLDSGVDSNNVIVENNAIYDNFALQLYIHRTTVAYVQRNLIYCTGDPRFLRGNNLPPGLILNNEQGFANNGLANNITIINNVIVGCGQNLGIWNGGNAQQYGVRNVLITRNALLNAKSLVASVKPQAITIQTGQHKQIQIHHNLIVQDGAGFVVAPKSAEIAWSSNFWTKKPAAVAVAGGDRVGDPRLINPKATLRPGAVDINWYKPKPSSPLMAAQMGPYEYWTAP